MPFLVILRQERQTGLKASAVGGKMLSIALTCAVGIGGGLCFRRFKIPASAMLGSLTGVALLNILFEAAYLPPYFKTGAQICAGAIIAHRVDRQTLRELPRMILPFSILIVGFLLLDLMVGGLIFMSSDAVSLPTALLMGVPGGTSDVALIADDMGGDTPSVLAMQVLRLIFGIGLMPLIPAFLRKREAAGMASPSSTKTQGKGDRRQTMPAKTEQRSLRRRCMDGFFTVCCATACGVLGYWSGVPAGALLFSLIGVSLLHLGLGHSYMPVSMRRSAMFANGCYIGSTIFLSDILVMHTLLLPALILLTGFLLFCLGMAWLLSRYFGFTIEEGLLIATPAGAIDMMLIAEEMGLRSADVGVMHIFRLLSVITLFPQIIYFVVLFYA